MSEIKYKKLVENAKDPFKKIITDAGWDLSAASINETPDYIEYGTGLAFEIPEGMAGLIFPRSSVTNQDLMLKNCVGVIDPEYRGEVRCRFAKVISGVFVDTDVYDTDNSVFSLFKKKKNRTVIGHFIDFLFLPRKIKKYEVGERVCQIIFIKLPKITLKESTELSTTDRGEGGFGSTGKK